MSLHNPNPPEAPCPCDPNKAYATCCQPYHQGATAETPEVLMSSRYSAFALGLSDYLLNTHHPSTRPSALDLADSPHWSGLNVLSASQQGSKGQVHFRAIYRLGDGWGYLEEQSDFIKEAGKWFYLAGKVQEGALKPGRNDRCPCGSGSKYKACCA